MSRASQIVLTILAAFSFVSGGIARAGSGSVLEYQWVHRLSVVELGAPRVDQLRLTGLVFHSSLAIDRIDLRREGDAVIVLPHLTLASGKDGQLHHTIDIPSDVNRVLFGEKKHEIWRRDAK
jgi:hypothetical protein